LQHHFVEDVLTIIKPLVGAEGSATGMQNHLIIRVSPKKMIEIEQIISSIDVARQKLEIKNSRNCLRNNINQFIKVMNGERTYKNLAISTIYSRMGRINATLY
jgi:hypothetical protein